MKKTTWSGVLLVVAGAAVVSVVAIGCQKTMNSSGITATEDSGGEELFATQEDAQKQAGALAWSQNCMRCHNFRRPRERSDREWEVIVHHMRVRANLTAEEHRLILRFLQSAN